MKLLLYIILIVLAVIAYELFIILIYRPYRRRNIYEMAQARAKETGKRLFVIGDPHNDNRNLDGKADYGCGDLCLDKETGCDLCPAGVKSNLEDFLPTLPDNGYVVFISCVLEYVDNFEMVKNELYRVSGGDLFIVNIEPNTFKTKLFPNLGYGDKFRRKRVILKAPPYSNDIRYKELK